MAPLVLPVREGFLWMLWAVVSSVVWMARVTQAMHEVKGGVVCAVGDALGTGGGWPERGLLLVQQALVALMMPMDRVLQAMDRVTVLLVMWTAGGGGFVGDRRW